MAEIACPRCGKTIRFQERHRGRDFHCPNPDCRTAICIPEMPEGRDVPVLADASETRPRPRVRPRRTSIVACILAGLVGVAVGAATMILLRPPRSEGPRGPLAESPGAVASGRESAATPGQEGAVSLDDVGTTLLREIEKAGLAKAEQESVEARLTDAGRKRDAANAQLARSLAEAREAETMLADANQRLETARAQLDTVRAELTVTDRDLERLRSEGREPADDISEPDGDTGAAGEDWRERVNVSVPVSLGTLGELSRKDAPVHLGLLRFRVADVADDRNLERYDDTVAARGYRFLSVRIDLLLQGPMPLVVQKDAFTLRGSSARTYHPWGQLCDLEGRGRPSLLRGLEQRTFHSRRQGLELIFLVPRGPPEAGQYTLWFRKKAVFHPEAAE